MFELGLAVFVGLMLGWVVIPQPAWAQKFYAWIKNLFANPPDFELKE